MAEKKYVIYINKFYKDIFLTPPLCKSSKDQKEGIPTRFENCMGFFIDKMEKEFFKRIEVKPCMIASLLRDQGVRNVISAHLEAEDVALGIMCLSDFEKLRNYNIQIGDKNIQNFIFNLDFDKLISTEESGNIEIKRDKLHKALQIIIDNKLVDNGSLSPLTVFLLSDSEHISTIIYDNINENFYSFDSMGNESPHKSILPDYVTLMNEERIQNASFCGYITIKFCKELFSKQGIGILGIGDFKNGLEQIVDKTKEFAQGITNPENKARGESDLKRAITEIKENIERNLLPSR